MERKKIEIRRRTRQQQVHSLRATIRENLVDSITKHKKAAEDNQSVLRCIREGNIDALFDLTVSCEWSNLHQLPQQSARECFHVLSLSMHDHKAAIVLQQLVKLHWDRIFLGRASCSQMLEQFLASVSERIEQLVGSMRKGVLDENGAASMGLNAYLSIFKQSCLRLTSTIQPACVGLTVARIQLIQQQLHNWLPWLLGNKLVLVCLAKVIGIETLFQLQLLNLFKREMSYTGNLIALILNKNDQARIPAFSILTTVVTEQPLSQRFVCSVTESYLDIMESFYYEYKQKTNREYHQLLFRAFEGLERLLSSAAVADYTLNVYQRLDINFFRLFFSFLGEQQIANRLIIYRVIIASIQLLRSQGINVAERLDRAHYSFLAKEIRQEASAQTLAAAIRLLLTLLRSLKSGGYSQYFDIVNLLEVNEVSLALEVLQFHSNREVALFAGQLLANEFQEQEYPQDFHWQENNPII